MIHLGDCVEVMAGMEAESVDAIVTDPPYDLLQASRKGSPRTNVGEPGNPYAGGAARAGGFMGKAWDATGVAFDVATWREAFRVAKPGAHLLAFGGTRTYHRLASAIEDAGWEIRDCLVWAYASGFPKSLDVSKAIDKRGGAEIGWFGPWLRQERERRGITQKSLAVHFPSQQNYAGKPASGGLTGCVGNWESGVSLPTNEQFNKLCEVLELPFTRLEEAEREVIAKGYRVDRKTSPVPISGATPHGHYDITAPATDAARQWDGWGTALKPAWEPIVMARKPLRGTVAANVQAFGTGALNIDATRIGTGADKGDWPVTDRAVGTTFRQVIAPGETNTALGRWPANLILTDPIFDGGVEGVVGGGAVEAGIAVNRNLNGTLRGTLYQGGWHKEQREDVGYGDSGTYSRFFLIPKAGREERERGLTGAKVQQLAIGNRFCKNCGKSELDGRRIGPCCDSPEYVAGQVRARANTHPTVKPIDLMRHLVRLVTPPGGTVLDPFLGSGTTAIACEMEGFRWIGIEKEAEYVAIAEARLNGVQKGLGLDVPAPTRAKSKAKGHWPKDRTPGKDGWGFSGQTGLEERY